MDEHVGSPDQHPAGSTRNVSLGSSTNLVQMRDLHGGNIYINSSVVVQNGPDKASPEPLVVNPLHVLVVDDDQHALDEIVRLLHADSRIGQVGAVTDAATALRYIHADAYLERPIVDAWFLDQNMPGLSGMELAWVGAHLSPAPSTVFVTASEEHAVDAFDLNAADYLVKPISANRLCRAVDRLCRRRQMPQT